VQPTVALPDQVLPSAMGKSLLQKKKIAFGTVIRNYILILFEI